MLQASCSNVGRARSLFERSLQADPRNMRARLGATSHLRPTIAALLPTGRLMKGAGAAVCLATTVAALVKQMAGSPEAAQHEFVTALAGALELRFTFEAGL